MDEIAAYGFLAVVIIGSIVVLWRMKIRDDRITAQMEADHAAEMAAWRAKKQADSERFFRECGIDYKKRN